MNEKEDKFERLVVKKYKKLLGPSLGGLGGGGIFTSSTRERLLTRSSKSNDFWYDRRNNVQNALIDLALFIEVAGKDNVNSIITEETLKPAIEALLWHPVVEHDLPDLKRAEIARLFIQTGFNYLQGMKLMPLSSQRTIEEAMDLSNYLVEFFKPESERRYSPPGRRTYESYDR